MLHVPTILFSTHANNIRCTNYDVPFTTFLLAPPVPFNTAQQGDSFYTFYTLSNGKTRNVLHKCVLKQLTFHSQMFNEPHSHLHTCILAHLQLLFTSHRPTRVHYSAPFAAATYLQHTSAHKCIQTHTNMSEP